MREEKLRTSNIRVVSLLLIIIQLGWFKEPQRNPTHPKTTLRDGQQLTFWLSVHLFSVLLVQRLYIIFNKFILLKQLGNLFSSFI